MMRVYLCHGEIQKKQAAKLKALLHRPDVQCFDSGTDILGNDLELSVVNEQITHAKWIVIIWSSDSSKSKFFTYEIGMAVDNALSICLRNIIVLSTVDEVKLMPRELMMFPCIVLEKSGWEKDLLNILTNTKPASIMAESSCRHKYHVNVKSELREAGFPFASEPECPLSVDDSGRSVIPHSQIHKVTARAKRRTLQDSEHPPASQGTRTYPKIQRLVREAQRKNRFYKKHATYIGNHKICSCYFYQVCTVPNIIICVLWLLSVMRVLGSTQKDTFIDDVIIMSYCALLLINTGTLVLFRDCYQLLSCIKCITCYKSLCWSHLFGLLMTGWVSYWLIPLNESHTIWMFLINKPFESMSMLTLIMALANKDKSQNTWIEWFSSTTWNFVCLILVIEVFVIKTVSIWFEWILFTTFTNIPYMRPINTGFLLVVSILFHLRQIYLVHKFRKFIQPSKLPPVMAKCQKSQRPYVHILTLLCAILLFSHVYILTSELLLYKTKGNTTSTFTDNTNVHNSPKNNKSVFETVLYFLFSVHDVS